MKPVERRIREAARSAMTPKIKNRVTVELQREISNRIAWPVHWSIDHILNPAIRALVEDFHEIS